MISENEKNKYHSIKAPEELKPVFVGRNVYQGTYIRIGEGDFKLKPYEVQKMLNEKNRNFGG